MMLKVYPKIEFSPHCPVDSCRMEVGNLLIPGIRSLVEVTCTFCGTAYYVDLPTGHAIQNQTFLDITKGKTYTLKGKSWFSELLGRSVSEIVHTEVKPRVHKFFDSDRIILLNCLDFLYGHSLLKLLNAQHHLEQHSELGCCVIVPSQLVHLVPEGVAEIWEFPISFQEAWKWHTSIQEWIAQKLTQYQECYLSPAYPHPSNQIYDLSKFVRDLPDIAEEIQEKQPIILFSYREDRLWGRNLKHQQKNLQQLYLRLSKIFPRMLFVLIGFGNANQIQPDGAALLDLRTQKFSLDCDRLWLAYMNATDCVVGVHGSNMLLPSGLAKSTVELVPEERFGNSVQDFLFPWQSSDPRTALLFYRLLYGNGTLSNLYPSHVTNMIANVLSLARHNYSAFNLEYQEFSPVLFSSKAVNDQVFKQGRSHLFTYRATPFLARKLQRIAELILELTD
jgi:hypothetical protein